MFRLAKDAVHGFDDGRFFRRGPEIVVENGLSDDVERDRAEPFFHVHRNVVLGLHAQVVDESLTAVTKKSDYAIKPASVETRDNCTTTDLLFVGQGCKFSA